MPHSKKLDGHTLGLNGGDGRVASVVAVVVVVVTVVEVKMEVIIVVPTIGVSKGTVTEAELDKVMVTMVCEEER